MDKKNIKRIIAKEGLIILGIIGVGCILITTPELYIKPKPIRETKNLEQGQIYTTEKNAKPWEIWQEEKVKPEHKIFRLSEVEKACERQEKIRFIGFIILLFGYPAYLLVRFIIWAIKTLKEKR